MSTELTMPKLGLTMKTGKVARWLVAEGASVHQGDEIFEVETDKITNKIECPADGVLLQILVPQGEVVEVGTVLGLLGEAGEAVATKPATAAPEAQAEAAPEAAAPAAQAPVKAAGSYILATPRAKALARFLEMDLCFVTPTGRNGRIREADVLARQDVLARIAITPLARVLASQAGLDICTLTGTGEGGKIVKADVERALNPEAAAAAEAAQPEAAAEESVRAMVLEEGGGSFARELSATLDMTACLALLADLWRLVQEEGRCSWHRHRCGPSRGADPCQPSRSERCLRKRGAQDLEEGRSSAARRRCRYGLCSRQCGSPWHPGPCGREEGPKSGLVDLRLHILCCNTDRARNAFTCGRTGSWPHTGLSARCRVRS